MTMSWLSLGGSADTELDSTTGKVFILSSIQAGGQLSLHLHVLPMAHCKWLWGARRTVLTQTMSARRSLPLGAQCPGRPRQGWGRTQRGLALTALGRTGGFRVSRILCILLSLHTSSPSSVLWTHTQTQIQTQTEICVSSLLEHSSSCRSQLKSQDSLSAPTWVTEVRKGAAGAAGAAPAWTGGGSPRPTLQADQLHLVPWLHIP